jgi:magnesium-transporting ATPase (P-type)
MIMAFFTTGKYVEAKARGRASMEIRKLLELGAKHATVVRGKEETQIPIEEVKLNDIMVIKPGEKIPTDGIVVKGETRNPGSPPRVMVSLTNHRHAVSPFDKLRVTPLCSLFTSFS